MLHTTMAALFAFAAIVQVNDPDPLRWILLYAAASVASLLTALGRRPPPLASGGPALLAVSWAAVILSAGGPGFADYVQMFDTWEMRTAAVEEAREVSGLLIVSAWMAYLARSS